MIRSLLQSALPSKAMTSLTSDNAAAVARPVVTDLTLRVFSERNLPFASGLDPRIWHPIEKDLCLHMSRQCIWLYVALADEKELSADDLVVTDVQVGELPPSSSPHSVWQRRPGAIWVLRSKFLGNFGAVVTEIDVLFGEDAVDPRGQWTLLSYPLQLEVDPEIPVARLSILRGRTKPQPEARPVLRVRGDGKFKIVQISDTHMGTGAGVCKDAIDASGNDLPEIKADPRTVEFIANVLNSENPDLVILTGDQLHHDLPDSQSALFKVVAPVIERSVPFAVVFGNHDSEGPHALPRTTQMSILQELPFSLCQPGPEHVDGIGNYHMQILAPAPSQQPLSTLYLLDSHGQIPNSAHNPNYESIKQSQIDWFRETSKAQQIVRDRDENTDGFHLSLVFQHIPVPEFGSNKLRIRNGKRREPTEGPSYNSHFYDALVEAGTLALGCGHDHVNDFCAQLLQENTKGDGNKVAPPGPWLCYAGCGGFRGYCSYGKSRYHRGTRIWELNTTTGSLKTWKRVEYAMGRVDELVLAEGGKVVNMQD